MVCKEIGLVKFPRAQGQPTNYRSSSALSVLDVDEDARAGAQETPGWQLGRHRCEGLVQQMSFLPNVHRHTTADSLQPGNIRQPQEEKAFTSLQNNLFLQARFGAKTFEQCVGPLWRGRPK